MKVTAAAQLAGYRRRVVKGAAGRQHHVDAGVERPPHRAPVARRQVAGAVEQGAVDIDGDQADRHGMPGAEASSLW